MVIVDDFVVSVGKCRSKEGKCFSVCWDVDGEFMEVLLKPDDAYRRWFCAEFLSLGCCPVGWESRSFPL